ncbi:MAG: PilZ domain-containing protein [Planctomycetota bacterium]
MLDSDYQQHLGTLIKSLDDSIELPPEMSGYFQESGPITPCANDRRKSVRTRVRTRCVIVPQKWLPAFSRKPEPQLAYTKDFSKTGFGFLVPEQMYPCEEVRVILATFWMEVRIRRSRRLGDNCFEVGGELVRTNEPTMRAFNFDKPAKRYRFTASR